MRDPSYSSGKGSMGPSLMYIVALKPYILNDRKGVLCFRWDGDHSNTLKHGLKQRVTNTMTPEVLEEQVGVREHQEID